jgi:hypothetical protein
MLVFIKRHIFYLFLISVISIIFVLPYFKSGFFETHDGEWSIVRLAEMEREIRDIQIPPRWSEFLNHGYGYPLFNFVYPFPYYIGVFLSKLGFNLTDSIKILFFISVPLSAYFLYILLVKFINKISAFIATIFYIIFPYRILNLYIRGSLGESLTLIYFPLILIFMHQLFIKPRARTFFLLTIIICTFFLIHNVMTLMFLPFVIATFFVFFIITKQCIKSNIYHRIVISILPYIIGFGLAAFFIIPALAEKKFLILSQSRIADLNSNLLNLRTNYFEYFGTDYSKEITIFLILIIFSLISLFENIWRKKFKLYLLQIFILIFIIIYFFLTTIYSEKIWYLPLFNNIDFPWRLHNIIGFLMAFLIGISFQSRYKMIYAFLVIFLFFTQVNKIIPVTYFFRNDSYYFTNDATTTSNDELMPIWVKVKPNKRYEEKIEFIQGQGRVKDLSYNSKTIQFNLENEVSSKILINQIYFPGWNYYLNDKRMDIDYTNSKGLVTFNIDKGNYRIKGIFTETPIRLLSNYISILSFVGLLYITKKLSRISL